MPQPDDSFARSILDLESAGDRAPGLPETLARIGKPGFKVDVGDSPEIFQFKEADGQGAVMIISNPAFPDFAAQGGRQAQAAAALLPPALGRHVLAPHAVGQLEGRSYALYPQVQTLSANPALQRAQLALIAAPVRRWLGDIASSTRTEAGGQAASEAGFRAPYRYLIGEPAIPGRIRAAAEDALAALEAGRFRPVHILQHGDFWRGNLLLGAGWPKAAGGGLRFFAVIDWGSSTATGYPFIDLLRFSRSLKTGDGALRRAVGDYAATTSLPAGDLTRYLCAHAGKLGLTRNEFPFERYVQAIERLFDRVDCL